MTDWTGNPGNHRDPYGRGWWHRHWLLSDGEYIKTSQQRGIGLMQFVSKMPEAWDPDRVGFWDKHMEQAQNHRYPPSHHKGAALWMPSEPGSRHWPGCGCP